MTISTPSLPESEKPLTPLTKENRDSLFFRASRVVEGLAVLPRPTLRERMDWAKTIRGYEALVAQLEGDCEALVSGKVWRGMAGYWFIRVEGGEDGYQSVAEALDAYRASRSTSLESTR